ncbi:cyclin-like protein [Tothia fuscella]|uniref:RNA polymerase II holoenzyme cyclin-like subunit n=1 Tax=Tothia fuscella TaxID=1048955 RepID=A0A9P4NV06_9PEZI|nr:cyclin-like protein [Tothia fuscella]
MPSQSYHTPSYSQSSQEKSRDPTDILAELELQWIFSQEELTRTPSIVDGMSIEEERSIRAKGANFISQVGIMLKLPQTTLATAGIFFNRFLMRRSLVASENYKALHHYQIAATSLFLATKVEEACRKIKELVIACCRVAQKNPHLLVDEQTKDFWRWRDTILLNEDVLLEVLCFDLTVESPYKLLYDIMRYYNIHHNRKLRDSAWSFVNDSNMTQLTLLFTTRTIACAAIYCGAKHADVALSDQNGKPWWEVQRVSLKDIRRACNYMADTYSDSSLGLKPAVEAIYVGLRSPLHGSESEHKTRLKRPQEMSPLIAEGSGSEKGVKRSRDGNDNGDLKLENGNGHSTPATLAPIQDDRAAKRAKTEEADAAPPLVANGTSKQEVKPGVAEEDAGSEEGEVEE